jgi:hypothetical protein
MVQTEVDGHLSCYAELSLQQSLQSFVAIDERFFGDITSRAVRPASTAAMIAAVTGSISKGHWGIDRSLRCPANRSSLALSQCRTYAADPRRSFDATDLG